jgi:hypothetical protein
MKKDKKQFAFFMRNGDILETKAESAESALIWVAGKLKLCAKTQRYWILEQIESCL